MPVDFSGLASAVENAFGETVIVSRTSGGTYSPAARGYTGASSSGNVSIVADVQATNRVNGLDEVVINFSAATVAATSLGDIREDDMISVRGRARRVVNVQWQAEGTIIRVVCRSEKRAGA